MGARGWLAGGRGRKGAVPGSQPLLYACVWTMGTGTYAYPASRLLWHLWQVAPTPSVPTHFPTRPGSGTVPLVAPSPAPHPPHPPNRTPRLTPPALAAAARLELDRQSGGAFDLRVSAAPDDSPLHDSGCIIIALGTRYSSYCANIARTFIVNPTAAQQAQYAAVLKVTPLPPCPWRAGGGGGCRVVPGRGGRAGRALGSRLAC